MPNPAVSDPVESGVPVVEGEVIPVAGPPTVGDPGEVGPGVLAIVGAPLPVEVEPAELPDEVEGDDVLPASAPALEAPAPPAPCTSTASPGASLEGTRAGNE